MRTYLKGRSDSERRRVPRRYHNKVPQGLEDQAMPQDTGKLPLPTKATEGQEHKQQCHKNHDMVGNLNKFSVWTRQRRSGQQSFSL